MIINKPKSYSLRFRTVNLQTFNFIRNGKKRVETRAGTIKYKKIKAGETLIFVCGKSKFSRKIKAVYKFRSISSLLKKFSPKDIDPTIKDAKELIKMYHSYPNYEEKIKKFGLIALKLDKK